MQDRFDEALDVLAPVVGRFTEGFECSDLKAAKELLDKLENHSPIKARDGSVFCDQTAAE
jgi:predicted ATPase